MDWEFYFGYVGYRYWVFNEQSELRGYNLFQQTTEGNMSPSLCFGKSLIWILMSFSIQWQLKGRLVWEQLRYLQKYVWWDKGLNVNFREVLKVEETIKLQ